MKLEYEKFISENPQSKGQQSKEAVAKAATETAHQA